MVKTEENKRKWSLRFRCCGREFLAGVAVCHVGNNQSVLLQPGPAACLMRCKCHYHFLFYESVIRNGAPLEDGKAEQGFKLERPDSVKAAKYVPAGFEHGSSFTWSL